MTMERWQPFSEMARWRDEMDRLFGDFFETPYTMRTMQPVRLLPLDMYETQNEVVVKATVAGMRPEDISISVTGNTLTIQGERKEEHDEHEGQAIRRERWYGSFRRDITLPTTVRSDQAEATFDNGVLTLRMPKSEEARPKRIEVKSTGQHRQGMERGQYTEGTQQGQFQHGTQRGQPTEGTQRGQFQQGTERGQSQTSQERSREERH